MFGWKKEQKTRPARHSSGKSLSQYGLFDIPGTTEEQDDGLDVEDNDSDLEAELAALTSGSHAGPKRVPKKPTLSAVNLDSMVAASLRDIPSDEDVSGDDDDPELLSELNELTETVEPVTKSAATPVCPSSENIVELLNERIKMYTVAESHAKAIGETSRARRFDRGLKTLNDLLKSARAGRPINEDDIPPVVSTNAASRPAVNTSSAENSNTSRDPRAPLTPTPGELEPAETASAENANLLKLLNQRKTEYRTAALNAKRANDSETALKYIKVVKQFQMVITAVENGQAVDLSKMPGPPSVPSATSPPKQNNELQKSTSTRDPSAPQTAAGIEIANDDDDMEEPALITGATVLEALEQRLLKYKGEEQKAKNEENGGKARRMGRIVKQYEQAIKQCKAGNPVPNDELPIPPGYGPLPGYGQEAVKPDTSVAPATAADKTPSPAAAPARKSGSIRKGGNQTSTTFNEKQLAQLLAKQKEFKLAALNAKKKGELTEAKEYLRTAKGFEPLIEAAKCGLPVDMTTVPIPVAARSQLEDGFDFVMAEECIDDDSGVLDIMGRLEDHLMKQLKMCMNTRDHHKALGDVAGTNRFEQLALSVTRDLDLIRVARRTGDIQNLPKFHYETKQFSVVQSCTDLTDDELELTIVRGINYRGPDPNDIDTYVKFEFPFPQEEPVRDRTTIVKNTNNPDYSATFKIPIQRKSRACLRVFKRHGVKLEVYSRGGLFRSDSLVGAVTVKLQPLETKCELHDSFELMEGRKAIGGKLEVRIRIRDPLLTRQVEELSEKWLIIDT